MDELERFVVAAVKSGMGKEKIVQYAIEVLRNLRVQLQQREEVLKLKTQQALLSKREEENKKQLLDKKNSQQVKWDE